MTTQTSKGYKAEEDLRAYFLSLGYFVLRGVKLKREGHDFTDIDLLLFGKMSPLTRERINVDIKNKKTPQAPERIFFANGIKNTLGYDHCVVATTAVSPIIQAFAEKHDVIFLNGDFLKKVNGYRHKAERISEEELTASIRQEGYSKHVNNYVQEYEILKSRMAYKIDFSTVSEILMDCRYFLTATCQDYQYRLPLVRCFFYAVALLLIALDYINKDFVTLSNTERDKRIREGFMYGSRGEEGSTAYINRVFNIIAPFLDLETSKISLAKKRIDETCSTPEMKILSEYFSRTSVITELFKNACHLEKIAFAKNLVKFEEIPSSIKALVLVVVDYIGIDRKAFLEAIKQ